MPQDLETCLHFEIMSNEEWDLVLVALTKI